MSNSIVIVGNVGKDPVLRYTQAGKAVANFTAAVYAGKDFPPMWFNVVAWDDLATQAMELCAKGRKVEIGGYLSSRKWTDKQGAEKLQVEIVAQNIGLVDVQPKAQPAKKESFDYGPPPLSDDDIQF